MKLSYASLTSLTLISCFFVVNLPAQEFQIVSTTGASYVSTGNELGFSERLDGSYRYPLDSDAGKFTFKAHAEASRDGLSGDVDTLSLQLNFAKPGPELVGLRWTLGRFLFSDVTQLVMNHPVDGSDLDLDFGVASLRLVTAYTGLVMKSSSGVALSLADQDSTSPFATPRFLGSLKTGWEFLPGHTATFGATAQQDITSRSRLVDEWTTVYTAGKGGKVDTQYLSLKVDGPIVENLFYQVSGTFESGTTLSWVTDSSSTTGYIYQNKPISAFLLHSSLDYFMPQVLSSTVGAKMLFASGDSDATAAVEGNSAGQSNLFVAITPTPLGTVFSPALANLGYYEVNGSLKPIPGLPFVVTGKLMGFQRLVSGVVNAPGVLRLGPVWMGQEVDAAVSWQVVSDFQCGASLGAFFPSTGTYAAAGTGNDPRYSAKLTAKLTF